MDYLLPTAAEVPIIEYGHVETPSPGPGGYKGVGEGGAIGAPPAVVNAVADALAPFGVRVTDLPLTPSRHRCAARREDRPVTDPVYYDPYDVDIDADPYPVFRRLREEAPLYYNEQYDFYAAQSLRRRRARAGRPRHLHLGTRRHPRADQGEHRDAAGHPDLRGPARRTPSTGPCSRGCSRRGR